MLNVRPFGPGWRVVFASEQSNRQNDKDRWDAETLAEVESLWQEAKAERGDGLFNGGILSLDGIEDGCLKCSATEYKFFLAQRRKPSLFSLLKIRCLAVSGLLQCHDGLVLGQRSLATTQDAGCWEFVPSGGIEPSAVKNGTDNIDFISQLRAELFEETGIDWKHVVDSHPVLLVEDEKNRVVDIVVRLYCPELSREQVLELHRNLASREYEQIAVVSAQELSKSGAYRLSELSTLLLRAILNAD